MKDINKQIVFVLLYDLAHMVNVRNRNFIQDRACFCAAVFSFSSNILSFFEHCVGVLLFDGNQSDLQCDNMSLNAKVN